jgi:hypothetical protein
MSFSFHLEIDRQESCCEKGKISNALAAHMAVDVGASVVQLPAQDSDAKIHTALEHILLLMN